MENKFYIYAHTIASHGLDRPFGEVFYIGQGCGRRAKRTINRSKHWQNIVNKYGFKVHYFETELNKEQANLAEIRYIKAIGRKDLGLGTLCNFTDGGSGNSGYIFTEEHKKKISESNMGHVGYWKDKKLSDNTKKKMSEIHKGNKYNTGVKRSKETIDKKSKEYSFIDENGNIFKGKNLNAFAKENGYNQGHLNSVRLNKRKSHKGLKQY